MWSLLLAVAWSAPSEEVIVYADAFARWDGTRWWVEDEMVLPSGLALSTGEDLQLDTHALQVRAIVACSKDGKLGARRWEVSCALEDVGLQVTTLRHWRPEARDRAQQVLDQLDARLTGARVQMQVDDHGGISNFDLEGISADNLAERQAQESLRTVVSQLMAGFHLQVPEQAQRDGQWIEKHTELLDIPSITAARGSTVVVHQTSAHEGNRLVQTVGHGTVAVAVTWSGTNPFNQTKLVQSDGSDSAVKPGGEAAKKNELFVRDSVGSPTIEPVKMIQFPPPVLASPTESSVSTTPRAGEQRTLEIEAVWSANLSAVALFEKATGVMTERVWAATATATASSANGTGPYLNVGRLYRLAPGEAGPEVGETQQVAWPGQPMAGLAPWVDLAGP